MQSQDQKNEKIEEEKSAPAGAGRDKLYSEELLEEDFEVEKDLDKLPI